MGSFNLCVSNAKRVCQSLHKRVNSRTSHCTTMVFVSFLYLDYKDSFDLEFTFCPILKSFFKKTILFLWVLFIFFSSILSWLLLLIALTKQNSLNISQNSKKYEGNMNQQITRTNRLFFCLPCLLCRIYRFVDKNLQ